MSPLTFYRLLVVSVFAASLSSCAFKVAVKIPTDDITTAPDHVLIQKGIAIAQESYLLNKQLYKSRERKNALREICKLSDQALQFYREAKIDQIKYDRIQQEAKYVVQHAIYRMKGENGRQVAGDDPILDYLNRGIQTLKEYLQ